MEKYDIAIIGAGVVGLAIARELSAKYKNIIVIEKNDSFGRETSSRNSEVIHSGLYYTASYFRTRLCVEGNPKLYEYCLKKNIPHKKTGKLVIASGEEDSAALLGLYKNASANGVSGIKMLGQEEIRKMEPDIRAEQALYAAETGIIDSHSLMSSLKRDAEENGVFFAFNCELKKIRKEASSGFVLEVTDVTGDKTEISVGILINSAGLYSDRIAEMAGIDIEQAGYRLYPSKGEYFSLSGPAPQIKRLIYPVPQKKIKSLGIHTVLDLAGRLRFGPNEKDLTGYFKVPLLAKRGGSAKRRRGIVKEVGRGLSISDGYYSVDESHKDEFYNAVSGYLPWVKKENLTPDMAGIRPKLKTTTGAPADFIISEESSRGFPGMINLVGIESPGLTACLSVAGYAAGLI